MTLLTKLIIVSYLVYKIKLNIKQKVNIYLLNNDTFYFYVLIVYHHINETRSYQLGDHKTFFLKQMVSLKIHLVNHMRFSSTCYF